MDRPPSMIPKAAEAVDLCFAALTCRDSNWWLFIRWHNLGLTSLLLGLTCTCGILTKRSETSEGFFAQQVQVHTFLLATRWNQRIPWLTAFCSGFGGPHLTKIYLSTHCRFQQGRILMNILCIPWISHEYPMNIDGYRSKGRKLDMRKCHVNRGTFETSPSGRCGITVRCRNPCAAW